MLADKSPRVPVTVSASNVNVVVTFGSTLAPRACLTSIPIRYWLGDLMASTYIRRLIGAGCAVIVTTGGLLVAVAPQGNATGVTLPDKQVVTVVLPIQINPEQSDGVFPFTVPRPPTEGVAGYTVPKAQRLVIESAFVQASEEPGSSPRSAMAARLISSYDLGSQCAYPGYERDYYFSPTMQTTIDEDRFWSGSIQGPIYVEGGRQIQNGTTASYGDTQLFVFITVHGYLEPAVNPSNPKPPTCH